MTPLNLRDRVRKLPGGDLVVHVVIFVIGLAFIGLGLALAPLPGPFTIPPVLLGLLIWALEFDFAQRWADHSLDKAKQAWESAREHPVRTGLVTASGIALVVVAAVTASRLGLVDRARDLIT